MTNKQRLVVLVGLLVSAVFLWFAFRSLNPLEVLDELRNAHIGWVLAGVGIFFLAVYAIAWRWQFMVNAIQPVPFTPLNNLVWIGYMGNNVYPFRAGEALRAYLLQRNHGIPIMKGGTTIVVERLFDGVVLVTFVFASLLFLDVVSDDLRRLVTFTAPVFLLATAAFFVLAAFPGILRQIVRLVTRILPGVVGEIIGKIAEDIIAGLEILRSPVQLAGMVFASYLTWFLQGFSYWAVAVAFGIEATYPLMLLVVGAANLAGLIPASPGQIGVFEFFASAVLIAAGVDAALALTYALTVHVVVWLPMTVGGFVLLARQGLGWGAIANAHQLEESAMETTASQ